MRPSARGVTRREFVQAAGAAGLGALLLGPGRAGAQGRPPEAVYPDDAFSRPAVDRLRAFETLAGCSAATEPIGRAAHFERHELLLGREGEERFVRLLVNPRDVTSAPLSLSERLRRPPTAVCFRVRNRGDRPLKLSLLAPEAPWWPVSENVGITWVFGGPQEAPAGAEAELRFLWADRFAMTPGDHAEPRFPMNALVLQTEGFAPGREHEVQYADLRVEYPYAEGALVYGIALPTRLRTDEPGAVTLRARVPEDAESVDLEFRREPWVLWRERLTVEECAGLRRTGAVSHAIARVPFHLAGESLTVGLVVDGYRAEGPEARVTIDGPVERQLPNAERREVNGRPTCIVNGAPFPWWGYSSYEFQPGNVSEFARHGVNVPCIPLACGAHVYAACDLPNRIGPEEWDFGQLEERVGFCLTANPDAYLTLRLSLAMPPFWLEAHRSEAALVEVNGRRIAWEEAAAYPAPSIASEVWQTAQEEAVRSVIRYCRSRPWAERLIGFWLSCEVTEEWFAWGCNDGRLADYSPPNQARFRAWLTANGLAGSEITEPIPGAAERNPTGFDLLPDTETGRRVAAYQRYYTDLHAEVVGRFARVVKEETDGRSLVGAFLAYVVELAGEPRQATAGHMPLTRLLADPHLDFLAGVPLLDYRTFPDGYIGPVSAMESILAHGKLFCVENDLFSWLHPLLWHVEYDPADPRAGAIAMHERVLGYDAVHGCLAQKFSLMSSWHRDDGLQEAFARHQRVYAETLRLDRTPTEEIALVLDDTSFGWLAAASVQPRRAVKELLRALAATGAPVGVWLLSDLDRLPERIRFVALALAPAPLPEDATRLRSLLERGGRMVLAVGTVVAVDPARERWQPDAARALLGLPLTFEAEGSTAGGAVLDASGEWVCANDGFLRPRLVAETLGLLRYPDGKPASAERTLADGGQLIWCGVPPSRASLLREWARAAGVHCYAPEGYVVHAARGLVSITAPRAEEAALDWPDRVRVSDLLDDWTAEGTTTVCPFRAGQTRLLEVQPRA